MLEYQSQALLSLRDKGNLYPVGMAFKDRLKLARSGANKTQAQIAAALSVSNQAVSGWERGESMPEPDKIPVLARFLGRSTSWLLDEEPSHIDSEEIAAMLPQGPSPATVKLKGYVGAGSQAHFYRLADDDYEEVPAPLGATDQTIALEIKGTSWGPAMEGWVVFYRDIRSPVTSDLVGRTCVVGLADDRILVKKIARDGRGGFRLLSNSNEPPIEDAQIEWAAKITDMRPR